MPASAQQLVSVIVPLYNQCAFIRDCILSVASQTHRNLEVVVVDDCSTDVSAEAAAEALREFGHRFSAHRIVRHNTNKGLACARNTAVSNSSGESLFALDSDNLIYPRAIERLLEALLHTGAAASYSQIEVFGDETGLGDADVWDADRFKERNYVDAMALVSRRALEDVGGYSVMGAPGWEDYDLWCKFVAKGYTGVYVPEILCRYRARADSMVRTRTKDAAELLTEEMHRRHPWMRGATLPLL